MERAQALLFVLFLLLILGILVGVLTVMLEAEIKTRSLERDGLIAFYLAQAGIERGKEVAVAGFLGWSPCMDDANPSCWYTELNGGSYKFYIEDVGGNLRRIQSKGRAISSSGETLAERQLSVDFNISGKTEQPWSWQEI